MCAFSASLKFTFFKQKYQYILTCKILDHQLKCQFRLDAFLHISDPVLQFLLAGLQEPRLSSVSAQALQSIASTCRDHMKSHFHGLIQIAEAMDTFNLSSEAAIGLLKGMSLCFF